MTLEEVLFKSDSEIERCGDCVKIVAREYRDITGIEPCGCDSQIKEYIRVIRLKYKDKDMNTFTFEGLHYNAEKITEAQKNYIKATNEAKYKAIASRFGWDVEKKVKVTRKKNK